MRLSGDGSLNEHERVIPISHQGLQCRECWIPDPLIPTPQPHLREYRASPLFFWKRVRLLNIHQHPQGHASHSHCEIKEATLVKHLDIKPPHFRPRPPDHLTLEGEVIQDPKTVDQWPLLLLPVLVLLHPANPFPTIAEMSHGLEDEGTGE